MSGHAQSGGDDHQRYLISTRSTLRAHKTQRLCPDRVQQRTDEQLVNKHFQHVVNSVEVKRSNIIKQLKRTVPKIIKNTVQRKNPIIQEKINLVKILKTMPNTKLGSDNDLTGKDQSV